MAISVNPGQWVQVKVKSRPKTESGRKTLVKLLEKDPASRKEAARQKKARPVSAHRRGGRMWNDRPRLLGTVEARKDATARIFASLDVIRELNSIEPYVEVTPAK